MTVAAEPGAAPSLIEAYRNRPGVERPTVVTGAAPVWDEVTGRGGDLLPGWADVARAFDGIGRGGLSALTALVDRLIEDDGVTYTPLGGVTEPPVLQRWPLDPVPLLVSGQSLLDIGCGPGTITLDLARRVAPGQTVGVDRVGQPLVGARLDAIDQAVTESVAHYTKTINNSRNLFLGVLGHATCAIP